MAVRAPGLAMAVCAQRAAGSGCHGALPVSACATLVPARLCPLSCDILEEASASGRLLEEHLVCFGLAACGGAARVRLLTTLPHQTRQTETR